MSFVIALEWANDEASASSPRNGIGAKSRTPPPDCDSKIISARLEILYCWVTHTHTGDPDAASEMKWKGHELGHFIGFRFMAAAHRVIRLSDAAHGGVAAASSINVGSLEAAAAADNKKKVQKSKWVNKSLILSLSS